MTSNIFFAKNDPGSTFFIDGNTIFIMNNNMMMLVKIK